MGDELGAPVDPQSPKAEPQELRLQRIFGNPDGVPPTPMPYHSQTEEAPGLAPGHPSIAEFLALDQEARANYWGDWR